MIINVGLKEAELVFPSEKSTDRRVILLIKDILGNEVRVIMNKEALGKLREVLE